MKRTRETNVRNALLFLAVFLIAPVDARASGRLFVNSPTYQLEELDPVTGALIGTTTITGWSGTMAALAYDVLTDTMFMSNTSNADLWRLDYHTGVATLVGPYNVGSTDYMHGLAIDDTGQIFGCSYSTVAGGSRFFSIDRTTGAATVIATLAIPAGFGSLEFVAATQTMYFADTVNQRLYTIDRGTGALALVGQWSVAGQLGIGLAYDATLGMYAVNNTPQSGLYKIDLLTANATLVTGMSGNRIALTFADTSTPSTSFCTGDAAGTSCLACGNNGAAGRGCANSSFASGAQLQTTGIASLAGDTLVLKAKDVTGPGLFFQSNGILVPPLTFGDGMLCAALGLIRLGVVFPTAGTASYPGGITPNPVSVGGAPIAASDVKHYQCWYRDAIAFCSGDTFNLTQGVTLTWAP